MNLAAVIVLPYELPSQNAREKQHWSAHRRERKALTWRIRAQLPAGGCPACKRKRRVEVMAYRRRRITDQGNLIGGAKALLDALVAAGLLVDDSETWMDAEYGQALYRAAGFDAPTTTVRIYDLEGA